MFGAIGKIRAVFALGPLLCAAGGCGPIPIYNNPLRNPQALRDITSDGYIVLENNQRTRLARIQMMAPAEQDDKTWRHVKQTVGNQVELLKTGSGDALAYYKARRWMCGNVFLLPLHFHEVYGRACLNDLLVSSELATPLSSTERSAPLSLDNPRAENCPP